MADKRNKKLIEVIEENSSEWLEQVPAVLGDTSGNVDAGGALVYARLSNGYPIVAVNYVAPLIFDLQILVGRSKSQPGYFQVISVRQTYTTPVSNFVKYHHEQHEFPAGDTVWVNRKQMMPLTVLVLDAAAFTVRVFGAVSQTATGIKQIETTDLDLSSYAPTAGAKYVSIEVDDDGVLSVHDGDTVGALELLTAADIPIPDTGKYFCGHVLLYESQAELSNDDIYVAFPLGVIAPSGDYQIHNADEETTLNDADEIGFWNSVTELLGKITWANIVIQLTGIFDALYAALVHFHDDLYAPIDHTHTDTTRWEPLANGDPSAPALVFTPDGDVIMVEVEI